MRFEKAAVIGTGMMGPGIAMTLAVGGVDATILSRTEQGAAEGLRKARAQLALIAENGLAPAEAAKRAEGLLHSSSGLDAVVPACDLVIESAPEIMEFKQDLFARLDAIAKPDAVLATNTSGLSITEIASKCARPERVLTAHFWNPPHLMPLVELVKGERTSDAVVEEIRALLIHCGKSPVVLKKDRPGQLGNRLQIALVREAMNIVQEGIASAEDVDLAARMGFGLRLPAYGILEHQDMVGLDLSFQVTDYITRDLLNDAGAPAILREHRDAGRLGVKSGQGFYDWSKKDATKVRERRDQFVLEVRKRNLAGW
jgi:3-hydroxybutyryl-CoA dehydrogenase